MSIAKQGKFSETDTEALFDNLERDERFRSFWHPDGCLHWGYFDNLETHCPEDFVSACQRWDRYMLEQSHITAESRVLEVACGNGNTSIWLARETGCEVVGIDLCSNYIDNARVKASDYPSLRLSFQKESATNLPFRDRSFTHAWSQAALYHIPDLSTALAEAYRVLEDGGIFLFDDLVTPIPEVSEMARQYVYDRLRFEPTFSSQAYREQLEQLGFTVLQSTDLSEHLQKSYELVAEMARKDYPDLSVAFEKMRAAIASGDVGWYFHLCQKKAN